MTQPQYGLHGVQEHLIQSAFVAQNFRIKVLQPIQRNDNSERFPVLYATDSDKLFGGLACLANELQLGGETQRFILVGIGYEDNHAADMLRMRDLFTHTTRKRLHTLVEQLAQSPFAGGIKDLRPITDTTDSVDFLRFIREELMPYIARHYPALHDDNNYFGFSAGGTFGLHTMFARPHTFKRYILGSPGTSYNGYNFAIEMAKPFVDSRQPLNARVYMAVGELEEFYADFDLTTGYLLLAKFLKRAAIPGLDLTLRVFPDEIHATTWTLAFSHGVRTLFRATEKPCYRPDFRAKT